MKNLQDLFIDSRSNMNCNEKKTEKNFHLQQLFLKIFNFSLATKFSFLIYACCFFGEGEKVGKRGKWTRTRLIRARRDFG